MLRILLIFFFLTAASFSLNAEEFLAGFEDIPLPNSARQIENETFTFGNEEARYIEARIICKRGETFDSVKKFYKAALTQLGWTEETNQDDLIRFIRENDALEILCMTKFPLKISIILKSKN